MMGKSQSNVIHGCIYITRQGSRYQDKRGVVPVMSAEKRFPHQQPRRRPPRREESRSNLAERSQLIIRRVGGKVESSKFMPSAEIFSSYT